jgi:hypothetical protein
MQARRASPEVCLGSLTAAKPENVAELEQAEVDLLRSVETELALCTPFGESGYINSCTMQRYEHRLRMITQVFPSGAALLTALEKANEAGRWRILSDPTVRIAINGGVAHCKIGTTPIALADAEQILALAVECLDVDSSIPPLQMGLRTPLRIGKYATLWAWSDERLEENTPASVFRSAYNAQEKGRTTLRMPDEECLKVLEQGASLLHELLPKLSRSALDHALLLGIVDEPDPKTWANEKRVLPFNSFTVLSIPGSIFIARPLLKTPWLCAEYLLHEALHLKWYDLEHGHSMLRRGYNPGTSPRITSVWNRSDSDKSNEWPVCRSTAAFHVYVHLALFFRQVERRLPELEEVFGPFTGDPVTVWVRRCCDRAQYLGSEIQRNSAQLGPAGELFVAWLLGALRKMDRNPMRPGSDLHLQLDLYESEAPAVAAMLQRTPSAALSSMLSDLESIERAVARTIVAHSLGIHSEPYLSEAKSTRSHADAGAFRRVRAWISEQLRALPPQLLGELRDLESGKTLGQLVATMIAVSRAVLEGHTFKRERV